MDSIVQHVVAPSLEGSLACLAKRCGELLSGQSCASLQLSSCQCKFATVFLLIAVVSEMGTPLQRLRDSFVASSDPHGLALPAGVEFSLSDSTF